jgi:hypothetical protein
MSETTARPGGGTRIGAEGNNLAGHHDPQSAATNRRAESHHVNQVQLCSPRHLRRAIRRAKNYFIDDVPTRGERSLVMYRNEMNA